MLFDDTERKVVTCKGERYQAEFWPGVGWWIWKLLGKFNDPVYIVSINLNRCSCPIGQCCKHIQGLRAS